MRAYAASWPTCAITPVEARVVITTAPGEEGQVDYGEGPLVRDGALGKYRRTRLLVLTRGYSRKSVRLIVPRSSAQIWAELHERAFRRLGGSVRWMVLDNLTESASERPGDREEGKGLGPPEHAEVDRPSSTAEAPTCNQE